MSQPLRYAPTPANLYTGHTCPHSTNSNNKTDSKRTDGGHQFTTTNRQQPVKLMGPDQADSSRLHKRIFTIFFLYVILIVSLYVTYAAYYCYQNQVKRHQQQETVPTPQASSSQMELQAQRLNRNTLPSEELEAKVRLLERYVDMIAMDLQETKGRLKEREKCHCSISCTFNGTTFADRSSWQHQCDTCTCQLGKISCAPKKCPPINCDDYVQLPGQCCPTCMKKCKHNGQLIRHGQKFNPATTGRNSGKVGQQAKECKCLDGVIKCESAVEQANRQQFASRSYTIRAADGVKRATKTPQLNSVVKDRHESQMTDAAVAPAATAAAAVAQQLPPRPTSAPVAAAPKPRPMVESMESSASLDEHKSDEPSLFRALVAPTNIGPEKGKSSIIE